MISICIPVYNSYVKTLADELKSQIADAPFSCEIIFIDDASEAIYRKENKKIESTSCRYIQLDKNIGRANIRNLFPSYANYEYLLYIDCDSKIIDKNYIKRFYDTLQTKPDVVCAGSIYPNTPPEKKYRLHWKYGKTKESNSSGRKILKTNNFLIRKDIFDHVQFDKRIKKYGHEDTLMGFLLKQKGYTLEILKNPVLNAEPDLNSIFLLKTDEGIGNLWLIFGFIIQKQAFVKEIKLLRTYFALKRYGLIFLLFPIALIFNKPIRFALCNGLNSIFIFNVYKLFRLILRK